MTKAIPNFETSDIFYQLMDLAHLVQANHDILHEMSYESADGSRNEELDRVAGINRIVLRDVQRLVEMTSIFDGTSLWCKVEPTEGQL